jgi:hypothetical protein
VARLKTNPHPGTPGQGRSEPAPGGDAGRGQLIQVATRCATLDEFVERFAAFAWEGSLVLPAANALPIGTQGRFVILLRDQTVAMRGRCRVTEAKPTPVSSRNPAVKKIMMRVALLEMDEASRAVHRRLTALRSAPVPLPIPPEPSETTQIEPARQGGSGSVAKASAPPAAAPSPPAVAAPPTAPAPAAKASPTPPWPPAPTTPAKASPTPPVSLNRTMIGIGVGPDGKAFLPQKASTTPSPPASTPSPPAITPSPPATTPSPPAITPSPPPSLPGVTAPRMPTPARVETRVPGAPDKLPANPLSEFSPDDLDSFIECKLLEADEEMPPPEPTSAGDSAVPERDDTTFIRLRRLTAKLPAGMQQALANVPPKRQRQIVRWGASAVIAIAGIVIGYALRGSPPAPPPVVVSAAPPAAAKAPAAEPEIPPVEAELDAPKPAAPKPAAAPPPAAKPAPAEKAAVAAKPAPAAEKAAVAEKLAAAEKPAAAAPPAPAEMPAAAAKPAPAEKPAAAPKLAAAEKPAPAERPAPVVAAAGAPRACTARVVTVPKDAKVTWGDLEIGRSPVEGARVPCGPATVTIDRERWQTVTVDVDAQAGAVASVEERLRRPRATLTVTSTPLGAQIAVNRVAAGPAPRDIDVQRYEKITIKATMKGFQPWSKTVYLKDPDAHIDILLVPRK